MKAAMGGLEVAQRKKFESHRVAETQHKAAVAEWIKRDRNGPEPAMPPLTSYYIGDATLEAVCALLDIHQRGLLQKRDELSGWLGGFDKYSEGNEAAQWLEFHSANSVRIDRKGGDKKTIYIPRALVSVTGTIQEPVLRSLLSGDDAKHFDNGLAARFLMAMPPERTREWREAITPPELVERYTDLFKDLLALSPQVDTETGRREPVTVSWSAEAKTRFEQFFNAHNQEFRAIKSARLKSAWSKLEAQAARLSIAARCFHLPPLADVLPVPVLVNGSGHLGQPIPVLAGPQYVRRAEEFDAVGRRIPQRLEQTSRNQDWNVMGLTIHEPRRLLHGESGWELAGQHHEPMLFLTHALLLPNSSAYPPVPPDHPRHSGWHPRSLEGGRTDAPGTNPLRQ